jgi:hypothetical protein
MSGCWWQGLTSLHKVSTCCISSTSSYNHLLDRLVQLLAVVGPSSHAHSPPPRPCRLSRSRHTR